MPHNAGWDASKLIRAKEVAKTFLKNFGPLILTGLVAVIEHHWLDHSDENEEDTKASDIPKRDRRPRDLPKEPAGTRNLSEERQVNNSVRKLEREVAELKRTLSRKAKDEEEVRVSRQSPMVREEISREWRPPYQEEALREQYMRSRPLVDERPCPSSSQQFQQFPFYQQVQTRHEPELIDRSTRYRERHQRLSHRHHSIQRRRRRHRHCSVPARRSYEGEYSEETVHAGKVAALAGFVEAMHMSDIHGDWVGPKGARVGTTMAASFAASRSRDRDGTASGRETAVDVGTGLLVSRLVHGSSRRLEEDETVRRRRRWSYCY